MTNSNSEQHFKHGTLVPGFDSELGTRLKWVVDQIGTQKQAGEIASVKPEMIGKYISGKAKPSFYAIKALANAAGISLDWLATGQGAKSEGLPSVGIDLKLMSRCSEAFGKLYKEMGITLSMADLGSLAGEAYNDVIAATSDPDEQYVVIKALIARRRREILNETNANNQGKLSAS